MNLPQKIDLSQSDIQTALHIQTLGGFYVWREGVEITPISWGREKALHLFQFFVTMRLRDLRLHKEQIIEHLWPTLDAANGDRDFKVALHGVNKALEPERKPRTEPRFIQRHDLTYDLSLDSVWIDAVAFENLIAAGNHTLANNQEATVEHYQRAMILYKGDYLPERRYEDWSSAERERLQVLVLGAMTTLADLLLDRNPLESIRLTQRALAIDPVWENAYRIQMQAYLAQGNRPLAVRTYRQCVKALEAELGIDPLPETQVLYEQIRGHG